MYFSRRILTAALFALALPVAASAQTAASAAKLVTGTWKGWITTPGNQTPTDITFEVEYKADSLAITLVAGEHGKFPLNEIQVTDKKLSFFFTPGPKVTCVLDQKDTGYAGDCTDTEGNVVPLQMLPPAKDQKS